MSEEKENYLVVITATKGIDKSLTRKWETNFARFGAYHTTQPDKCSVFVVLVQAANEKVAETLGKSIIDRVLHFLDVAKVEVYKKKDVEDGNAAV